jgi:D-hexose-6-phosphate mutarotase
MDDLGASGWRNMVCVEGANALQNHVAVLAGATHTIGTTYALENLL